MPEFGKVRRKVDDGVQRRCQLLVQRKSILGEFDGGREHVFPRELAEPLVRQGHPANRARDADGAMRVPALILLVHGAGSGSWSGFAVLKDDGLLAAAWID